jgi:hypothetical protein
MLHRVFSVALASLVCAVAHAADPQWNAPRTPWGTPDLQGAWTNASLTSLERADMFKSRRALSDTEAIEFERTNAFAQFAAEDAKPTDPSVQAERTGIPAPTTRSGSISDSEILYTFTVEDPSTYTRPWRGEAPLRRTQDLIYEYACHEGNYALPGILAGAREQEKSVGKKP